MQKNINIEEDWKDTYQFIKDYKEDPEKRKSFNDLSNKIYGLDFEDWYQNGFWKELYIPYSMLFEQKVAANVSVNILDFYCEGDKKRFIQLGTVMTDEAHRNKGLIRILMSYVLEDYKNTADGIYLFANDTVLEFYPKFGFNKAKEYQYYKELSLSCEKSIISVSMRDSSDWRIFIERLKVYKSYSSMAFNNVGLIMFYLSKFMSRNVYYNRDQDAYVIAEIEDHELLIHEIFAKGNVDIVNLAQSFGNGFERIVLGFTPLNTLEFQKKELKVDDSTLFIMGTEIKRIMDKGIMFPTLSHA